MNRRRARLEREESATRPQVEVLFDVNEAVENVGKPFHSGKWKDREAVIAREMRKQGFSCTQIAEYLGFSVSTARRRLQR